MRSFIALFCVLFLSSPALADEQPSLPRFASIKSGKANLRVGPGENYPIIWVYKRSGLPVEIIEEHQLWRKVRDPEGDEGWMLKNLLTGNRTVVVTAEKIALRRKPESTAPTICYASRNVILHVEECLKEWCMVSRDNKQGWADKKSLWGVYPNEAFGE